MRAEETHRQQRKNGQMPEQFVVRGFMANIEQIPPLIITFRFNPTSISDNKEVRFRDVQSDLSGTAPGKEYTGGGDRTISFKIDLHGLERGTNLVNPSGIDNGISTELAKFRSFLYPAADAWAIVGGLSDQGGCRIKSPPTCYFGYGTKLLECVVTSITINETQFNSYLAPVRADVNVTLQVIEREGNALYEVDKLHRNLLATLGVLNISPV
jgi:hypothetical protein